MDAKGLAVPAGGVSVLSTPLGKLGRPHLSR
jgi:hypothetical protein